MRQILLGHSGNASEALKSPHCWLNVQAQPQLPKRPQQSPRHSCLSRSCQHFSEQLKMSCSRCKPSRGWFPSQRKPCSKKLARNERYSKKWVRCCAKRKPPFLRSAIMLQVLSQQTCRPNKVQLASSPQNELHKPFTLFWTQLRPHLWPTAWLLWWLMMATWCWKRLPRPEEETRLG